MTEMVAHTLAQNTLKMSPMWYMSVKCANCEFAIRNSRISVQSGTARCQRNKNERIKACVSHTGLGNTRENAGYLVLYVLYCIKYYISIFQSPRHTGSGPVNAAISKTDEGLNSSSTAISSFQADLGLFYRVAGTISHPVSHRGSS